MSLEHSSHGRARVDFGELATVSFAAGAEPIPVEVDVVNVSDLIDEFRLELVAAEGFSIDPTSVSLFPGDRGTLRGSVTAAPGLAAGRYSVVLGVVSAIAPDDVASRALQVDLAPSSGIVLGVAPSQIVGRGAARFVVTARNVGNDASAVTLVVDDDERRLRVRGDLGPHRLGPGESTEVAVRTSRRPPVFGTTATRLITVEGRADSDVPIVPANVVYSQRAVVPVAALSLLLPLLVFLSFAALLRSGAGDIADAVEPVPAPRPGVVSGVATSKDGPLVGATATLRSISGAATDEPIELQTTTDETGYYEFVGVPQGREYQLTISGEGFAPITSVVSPAGGVDQAVSVEGTEGSVAGRVVRAPPGESPEGTPATPLGDVPITLVNGDDAFTATSVSNGDVGRFDLLSVPTPAQYTLIAGDPANGGTSTLVDLGPGESLTDLLIVLPPSTFVVSGVVVDDAGAVVLGASVRANEQVAVTNELGSFNLVVDARPQRVTVTSDLHRPATVTFLPEDLGAGLAITLRRRPGTMHIVVNSPRTDISYCNLRPDCGVDALVQITDETDTVLSVDTDDSGVAIVPALDPGTYVVSVIANGYRRIEPRPVLISAAAVSRVEVELQPTPQRFNVFARGGNCDGATVTLFAVSSNNFAARYEPDGFTREVEPSRPFPFSVTFEDLFAPALYVAEVATTGGSFRSAPVLVGTSPGFEAFVEVACPEAPSLL